jgi:hypothetical protein
MPSIREFFDTDFSRLHFAHQSLNAHSTNIEVEVIARVHFDFDSNTKYISYFIPRCPDLLEVCLELLAEPNFTLSIADGLEIQQNFPGEQPISSKDLKFSGRVFIYSESELPDEDLASIKQQAVQQGLAIQFRGSEFAEKRTAAQKPLAFLSHDWRDKDDVARPLAIELMKLAIPVWYDEFSLKVGDSLRESIEKGLRECSKCILVLSPHFLSNEGWTKTEFNSIFTRQILEQTTIVLPIWHGVTSQDVFGYSPSLADRVGVDWHLDIDEVCQRLRRAIIAG